jgi:predicted acylesterase/phospholipase RssA
MMKMIYDAGTLVRPICLGLCILLGACSSVAPRSPVPDEAVDKARIEGIPTARFWGDDVSPHLEDEMNTLTPQQVSDGFPALYAQPHNYLAISGGGADGAYGAGLLLGWSERGDRPEFQMVTGISTGALTAPFAYLGPDYDEQLKAVYTTTSTQDILSPRRILSLLSADSAADSAPLREMLEKYVDDAMVEAIAREHQRGRALYIGTTDLDYMRPVIWDVGAIAASGQPGARQLIHKILLASASIPAAFPPVRIDVVVGDASYQELHVDGGTATQVFAYPAATDWARLLQILEVPGTPSVYVIRNARVSPTRNVVDLKLGQIAAQSIAALIRTQGVGDLYQIYALSRRDGIDFKLAYIPEDFPGKPNELFDPDYMRELFELGRKNALDGVAWHGKPPGWATSN